MRPPRRRAVLSLLVLALLAVALPGRTAPLPDRPIPTIPDEVPRVAFLARGDNPVDALAAGAVAGMLGGIVVLTGNTGPLNDAAARSLQAYAPDLVIITGGTGAVPAQAEQDVQDLGFTTRRAAGSSRYETAEQIAGIIDDLSLGRPLLAWPSYDPARTQQLVGEAFLGGYLTATGLETFDDAYVHGTVRAQDFDFEVPEDRYLMIPPEAFRPDLQHDYNVSGGATGVAGAVTMTAPLYLPDGAVITGFVAWVHDSSTATDVGVDLWSYDPATGTYDNDGWSVQSSQSTGDQVLTARPAAPLVVDMSSFAYEVSVYTPSGWDGQKTLVRGVRVEYRVAGP